MFVLGVKRFRHRQICAGGNSRNFQQHSSAVFNQVNRKVANRLRNGMRERQMRQLQIGHAFHHCAGNECSGLKGLNDEVWWFQKSSLVLHRA
jgi:hypothetical protein